ncbi:MAG: hypothetical protein ACXAB9_10480 [Candidatus Thorarchaeota archaeon]|jgi:hypothetical protein
MTRVIKIQFVGHKDPFVMSVSAWEVSNGVLQLWYPGTPYELYPDMTYAQGAWVSVEKMEEVSK